MIGDNRPDRRPVRVVTVWKHLSVRWGNCLGPVPGVEAHVARDRNASSRRRPGHRPVTRSPSDVHPVLRPLLVRDVLEPLCELPVVLLDFGGKRLQRPGVDVDVEDVLGGAE